MFSGRLNRWAFIWRAHLTSLLFFGAAFLLVESMEVETMSEETAALLVLGGFAVFLLLEWSHVVKRLHDINLSGMYYLLMLVPGVNLALGYIVTFRPGTRGPNEYGPDPLRRGAAPDERESSARRLPAR